MVYFQNEFCKTVLSISFAYCHVYQTTIYILRNLHVLQLADPETVFITSGAYYQAENGS